MKRNFIKSYKIHAKTPSNYQLHGLKHIKERVQLCISIFFIYLFLSLLHVGCPIKFLTGISCPGCGMTRAVISVFRLNFKEAFHYHPLFLITPVMLCLFLLETAIKPIYYKIAWSMIFLMFLLVYIIRLFITPCDIVSIDMKNGILLKLIHQISVGGFK